jgi:hypothetical protein
MISHYFRPSKNASIQNQKVNLLSSCLQPSYGDNSNILTYEVSCCMYSLASHCFDDSLT